jgi:hypothetical protein
MDKSSKSATIGPNLMERIKQSAMAVETGENRRFAQQGKWVSLDRYWKPLEIIAQQRHDQKRDEVWYRHWGRQTNPHLTGLMGETVFALATGLKVDKKFYPHGDKGYDFLIDLGFELPNKMLAKVDIKATTWYGSGLLVPTKRVLADAYVLAEVNTMQRMARLVGWIYRERLRLQGVQNFGYCDNFCAPQDHLNALGELWEQMGIDYE